MLNKGQIIGRLGRDVELRYTQSGSPVANFTVATDEAFTDRSGNRVENTEWHRVAAFGKQAETCSQYIGKGSLVYVEGRLRTRKWTDQGGQERSTTEINADRVLFLDRKADRQDGFQPKGTRQGAGAAPVDDPYGDSMADRGGAARAPRPAGGTLPPAEPPIDDDMPF